MKCKKTWNVVGSMALAQSAGMKSCLTHHTHRLRHWVISSCSQTWIICFMNVVFLTARSLLLNWRCGSVSKRRSSTSTASGRGRTNGRSTRWKQRTKIISHQFPGKFLDSFILKCKAFWPTLLHQFVTFFLHIWDSLQTFLKFAYCVNICKYLR